MSGTKKMIKADKYGMVGYAQLKAIIGEIMEMQTFPSWDFLNGVLSCKKVLGEKTLWFWWGNLLIVEKGQTRAGDMKMLDDWNTEADGTMTLFGKEQKSD